MLMDMLPSLQQQLTLRSLYVYNKIDSVSVEFLDKLAREPNTAVMSCEMNCGVQDVVDRCWEELRLMRVYTKRYAKPRPICAAAHAPVEGQC